MNTDLNPTELKTITEDGNVPKSRLRNASQAFEIADKLDKDDEKRRKKRSRIFKAYNRFAPSDYSTLFKDRPAWVSNVNFGMLAFVVDNNLSSFFDMVTERVTAAEITTTYGKPKDRAEFSEHISQAFDKVLREWEEHLFNVEQDVLDMLLFGKGIQMWEDSEGCMSEHISADDVLVPDNTKVSLCNWTEMVIKREYTLLELWEKIEGIGEEQTGWNKEAVINAMRFQREEWGKKTESDFLKDVADGNITFGGHLKEKVSVYIMLVKEFSGKVSKHIVLQDYQAALSLTKKSKGEKDSKKKAIDKEGFLYSKIEYADSIHDVLNVFMDCTGNGVWHRIPSLAEKIFVQCRQYDFTMNAIMDAVKMNMSLMLQPSTADAGKKIKELVFGPYVFIPSDVPFVQQRIQLPTEEAVGALQFMMGDMYRGLGEYRVHAQGNSGEAMTATQSQLDAAESAKLTGTQLKRFNEQYTKYFKRMYGKLVALKKGEKDYEHYEKFVKYLKEKAVPEDAWKVDSIDTIKSNMLAGAGSPSYKLMAAEKTLQITNITPRDEGQARAMEDALAALHGRANVQRYVGRMQPDLTWNERLAGMENAALSEMSLNPASVQVFPSDNHTFHISAHFADMEQTLALVNEKIQSGQITENFGEHAANKLLNQGSHVMAHMQFIQADPLKQDELKQYTERLNNIQRAADEMSKQMQSSQENKKSGFDPANDPDIQKRVAMGQLELSVKQKLAEIKIGAISAGHSQRQQIAEDKAANDIAIARVKEEDKLKTKQKLEEKQKQQQKPK